MNKLLVRKSVIFSCTVYLCQIINIIFITLLMRFLSPTEFGIFAIGRLIAQYFDFSHLGCRYAIDRYVPVSSDKKSQNLLHIGLFTCSVVSLFFLILLLSFEIIHNVTTLILCVGGISYSLSNIYLIYRRDKSDMDFLIKNYLIVNGLPPLLAMFSFSLKTLHLNTIVCVFVSTQLLITAFIFTKNNLYLYIIKFPKRFFKRLSLILVVGSVMLISNLVLNIGMTADRFFIKSYYGYHEVAVFTAILYVFNFIMILPGSLNEIFLPEVISELRKGRSLAIVYRSLFFLILMLLPVIVTCYYLTPILVNVFLPDYKSYSKIMSLASFVIIPYAFCIVFSGAFSAIDERKKLLTINFISLSIYIFILLTYFSYSKHINYRYLLEFKSIYAVLSFLFYVIFFNISFLNYKKTKISGCLSEIKAI